MKNVDWIGSGDHKKFETVDEDQFHRFETSIEHYGWRKTAIQKMWEFITESVMFKNIYYKEQVIWWKTSIEYVFEVIKSLKLSMKINLKDLRHQ